VKRICHGGDREEAKNKKQQALSQFVVQGSHTTIPLHQKIFADAEFRAGQFDTKFMERFFERQKDS
jgi:acetyl-CoA carboxylase biotin carboxylase subunit